MNTHIRTTWKPAPPRIDPDYFIIGLRWFVRDEPYPPELLEARRAAFLRQMQAMNEGSDTGMEAQLNDAGFGSAGII